MIVAFVVLCIVFKAIAFILAPFVAIFGWFFGPSTTEKQLDMSKRQLDATQEVNTRLQRISNDLKN